MNVLLDTCALCWVANDAKDLSAAAREAIEGGAVRLRLPGVRLGDRVEGSAGRLELPDALGS